MSPPSPAPGPPSQHEHYLHSVAKACLDLGAAPSEALVAWAVTVADMPSLVCLVGPRVPEACLAHAWISNQGARQGHEAALRALAALSPGLRASVADNSMMVWCAAVAGRANLVKWWLGLQQPGGKACLGFLRQALTAAITSSLDEHIIAQVVAELLPSCQPDSMHDNHGMEVGGHPITCCTTYNPSRAVMQALLDGGLRPPPSALQAVVRNLGRGGPHANPAMALWMVQQLVKAGAEVNAMNGAALREAAQRGDALLVKQLLSLGAQATQSTRAAAESCGHTEVLHLLSGAVWHPSSLPQPSTSDVTRVVAVSERLHGTTLSGQEPVDRELEAQPQPSQAQQNMQAGGEASWDRHNNNTWLRSMATRSRIRGLMCPTSNVIKRRFYDRDVSAALNIRRIAAGPGRPRELSSWLGRPAMPNPGRPGQEWVKVRDKGLLRKWQRRHQRQR
ncbi:hypothetical protein QJQ45_005963 [Haematococcus lacustris]|nr:hypothetical protein QJQ45_005963 [Haematococcus lacustris]